MSAGVYVCVCLNFVQCHAHTYTRGATEEVLLASFEKSECVSRVMSGSLCLCVPFGRTHTRTDTHTHTHTCSCFYQTEAAARQHQPVRDCVKKRGGHIFVGISYNGPTLVSIRRYRDDARGTSTVTNDKKYFPAIFYYNIMSVP